MSKEIEIVFADGKKQMVVEGTTLFELKKEILPEAVIGSIDGEFVDLAAPLDKNAEVAFFDKQSAEGIAAIRRLASLVLENVVKEVYPEALFAEHQINENGFSVDMRVAQPLSSLALKDLEKKMKDRLKADLSIKSQKVSKDAAKEYFKDNELKLALLSELPSDAQVNLYQLGEVIDFSVEPYALEMEKAENLALLKVSGAYWQGNSDNEMLQRLTGVVFATKQELVDHLEFLAESEKRSHQKLGKELELFMFSEEAPGMPFYLENGQIIRNELEKFLRELQAKYDYKEVKTPLIMNQRLWEQSGHWDHYKDNMYFTKVDDQDYALKPMNCPVTV